jgi:tetratricopeptide (TPR) repeat protein
MRAVAFVAVLLVAVSAWGQRPSRFGPGPVKKEVDEYRAAFAANDYGKALDAIDRAIKRVPGAEGFLISMRLDAMWMIPAQREAALAYAKKAADERFSESTNGLNNLAWSMISSKAVLPRNYYKEGIRLAQRAVTAASTGGRLQMLPYALDTLALGYFKYGDPEKAISTGERALEEGVGLSPDTRKEIEERISLFRAAAKKKR